MILDFFIFNAYQIYVSIPGYDPKPICQIAVSFFIQISSKMIYITIRMSVYSTETILYSPMRKINHQSFNCTMRAVTGVIKIYISLS